MAGEVDWWLIGREIKISWRRGGGRWLVEVLAAMRGTFVFLPVDAIDWRLEVRLNCSQLRWKGS